MTEKPVEFLGSAGASSPGLSEGSIGDRVAEEALDGGPPVRHSISYRWLFERGFVRAESERTADDPTSMGHARALIDWHVRDARAASPAPHEI